MINITHVQTIFLNPPWLMFKLLVLFIKFWKTYFKETAWFKTSYKFILKIYDWVNWLFCIVIGLCNRYPLQAEWTYINSDSIKITTLTKSPWQNWTSGDFRIYILRDAWYCAFYDKEEWFSASICNNELNLTSPLHTRIEAVHAMNRNCLTGNPRRRRCHLQERTWHRNFGLLNEFCRSTILIEDGKTITRTVRSEPC